VVLHNASSKKAQIDSLVCRTVAVIRNPANLAARYSEALSHYCGRQRKPNNFIPQQQFARPSGIAHAYDQNCSRHLTNRIYHADESKLRNEIEL
jgi:hypothetical protein